MEGKTRVIVLFLDGVGLGSDDPPCNPFFAAPPGALSALIRNRISHDGSPSGSSRISSMVPLDATLGVAGLPQSGTGQTALMTGVNASLHIGKHFGPYPYSSLRPLIKEHNIFRRFHEQGKSVRYVNAFPQQFFDYLKTCNTRISAITMSWLASGFELNDSAALREGRALSSDLTSERWNKLGFPSVDELTPRQAGRRLMQIGTNHDFTLFEFYQTDKVGHRQSMSDAIALLETLDEFVSGVLDEFDYENMLFVVVSDHGNFEDLTTKSHTRNPVPFLAIGKRHAELVRDAVDLTHFASGLERVLS